MARRRRAIKSRRSGTKSKSVGSKVGLKANGRLKKGYRYGKGGRVIKARST